MNTRPDFSITANSSDVTKTLMDRVSSVDVIQHSGHTGDSCILVLDDHRESRMQLPKPGDTIGVTLGYQQSELVNHGEYEVAEYTLTGNRDTLTIYANKLNWSSGLKAPKHRSWPSTADAPLLLKKVVNDIAGMHGLSAKISPQLGSIELPAIMQSESDMQLLTKLASYYDATTKVVEGLLIFVLRGNGLSRTGSPLPVVDITHKQLIKWNMLSSQQPNYQSCRAYYHDIINAERKMEQAGSGSPCFELSYSLADKATAKWAAQSRLNDFKRNTNTFTATLVGEADLMAGGVVTLADVRAGIDGSWFLTKVHHRIDSTGYVSTIECATLS